MYMNPFQGLELQEIYDGLLIGTFGPRWPEEKLQKGYTGTSKIDLLRRAFAFIDILDKDGAFVSGWKGLDYGCGWGRFGSTLLSKGTPEQLDLCDAWQITLDHLHSLNYSNHAFKVPSLLEADSVPANNYDFGLSFSVFTHLSPRSFEANIPVLRDSLKEGGSFYITVRHDEFLDHKYSSRAEELRETLLRDGIVFLDSGGDMNREALFGDTVVTPDYLSRYGNARYLGKPHTLQHVYAISR